MTTLYLVRHAKPAATWGEDPDPGLDDLGREQAQRTATALAERGAALQLLTSPLRRCRETALPLERLWNRPAEVFPPVAEIPAPPLGLAERHVWLQQAMAGTWTEMQSHAPPGSPDFLTWRAEVIASVRGLTEPAVIYTHFIAINVIVGAARGSDAVVCFRPDHASVTIVDTGSDTLRLVELGREAVTSVLTRN
jgi:broad specificity phosphatase PhoE